VIVVARDVPSELVLAVLERTSQAPFCPGVVVSLGADWPELSQLYSERGAVGFLYEPLSLDACVGTVRLAMALRRPALRQNRPHPPDDSRFIGVSPFSSGMREEIVLLAPSNLPVLVTGETGTGKDVIAQELHRKSPRRDKPFMALNCATLGSLADSELFGHTRGSFTGALRSTLGYIGSAEGGTLFLDEIGDLPLEVQAKLLRFLDTGEYVRVGETELRRANVRVVSASNLDLERLCEERRFRQDLLYRLSGATLRTVPLRDRQEDVVPLLWHFLEYYGARLESTFTASPEAAALLSEYDWPGNVRQLRQVTYQLCERSQAGEVSGADVLRVLGLPEDAQPRETYQEAKRKTLHEFDTRYFSGLLSLTKGSLQELLRLSGMHKKNFYAKISELGLSTRDFKSD
jgi:DNA-binding NtrC family response regulator